jgi:hypothetical protein
MELQYKILHEISLALLPSARQGWCAVETTWDKQRLVVVLQNGRLIGYGPNSVRVPRIAWQHEFFALCHEGLPPRSVDALHVLSQRDICHHFCFAVLGVAQLCELVLNLLD